ncbi:golgin IMH1-like [Nicotiana sylvestris]|uniref:golgin IMH1-like n=1 Tax=Nicotiana sylvestris TaxID=4096 RepID=UPI00388C9327
MAPGYLAWYRRELEHERPAKRPHILNFTELSQKQWDWLAKERGYRAEISKLKRQVESLKYEHNVQVATDLGEKNRLTQENEMLRAQIEQMRIDVDNQQRSRSDERLIKGLRMEIGECRSESENLENTIAGLEAHWAKRTEKRNQYLQQLKRDHEQTIANLKKKVVTLEDRAAEQARTFEAENRRCHKLLAQMEVEIQQWQNQYLQDSRIFDGPVVENLIEQGKIVLRDEEVPNVTNNPLPAHNNGPLIGMICEDKEFDPALKAIIAIVDVGKKPKAAPKLEKGEKKTSTVKVELEEKVETKTMTMLPAKNEVLYIPRGREVTGELPENTFIERYLDTQELNNATRKCFPPKKPVSVEEAEVFFQKMRMPDYEVVD